MVDKKDYSYPEVHIYIKQRPTYSTMTIVTGIPQIFLRDITINIRRNCRCIGVITPEFALQFSGDQREPIITFLISNRITTEDCIKIHDKDQKI